MQYISAPCLSHWCNDGFTFGGWVSISQEKDGQGTRRSSKLYRRMLYRWVWWEEGRGKEMGRGGEGMGGRDGKWEGNGGKVIGRE